MHLCFRMVTDIPGTTDASFGKFNRQCDIGQEIGLRINICFLIYKLIWFNYMWK